MYLGVDKENIIISKPLLNFTKFFAAKLCKISKIPTKIMVTSEKYEGSVRMQKFSFIKTFTSQAIECF